MNKIIVPKHVEAGMFDMGLDLGPFRVKMWQLLIIGVGVAIFFSLYNKLVKGGIGKIPAMIIASPVMIITLVLAFFRKSELYIVPFVVKLVRTYFINTPKTFQRNVHKPADYEVKIAYSKLNSGEDRKIEQKDLKKNELKDNLDVLEKW